MLHLVKMFTLYLNMFAELKQLHQHTRQKTTAITQFSQCTGSNLLHMCTYKRIYFNKDRLLHTLRVLITCVML